MGNYYSVSVVRLPAALEIRQLGNPAIGAALVIARHAAILSRIRWLAMSVMGDARGGATRNVGCGVIVKWT